MLDLFRPRSGIAFVLVALVLLGIVLRVTGRMGLVEDSDTWRVHPGPSLDAGVGNGLGNLFGGFRDVNQLTRRSNELQEQLNTSTIDRVRVYTNWKSKINRVAGTIGL